MIRTTTSIALAILAGASYVFASSAEFILYSNCHTGTFPGETYTNLMYNSEDYTVGLFYGCDACYNFSGIITDEGYYEVTESEDGSFKESMYMNIDDNTGAVYLNSTAITSPYLVATHLIYFDSVLDFSLSEVEYNETYHLYFIGGDYDYDVAALGTNYSTTLNAQFANGSRYLYYEPDESTTTYSYSRIDHIPLTADADATTYTYSTYTDDDATTSTAASATSGSDSSSSAAASSGSSTSSSAAGASTNVYKKDSVFVAIAVAAFGFFYSFLV